MDNIKLLVIDTGITVVLILAASYTLVAAVKNIVGNKPDRKPDPRNK